MGYHSLRMVCILPVSTLVCTVLWSIVWRVTFGWSTLDVGGFNRPAETVSAGRLASGWTVSSYAGMYGRHCMYFVHLLKLTDDRHGSHDVRTRNKCYHRLYVRSNFGHLSSIRR